MMSKPLSISTNQSGGVWNAWNLILSGRFRVSLAKRLPRFCCGKLFSEQFKALKTFVSGIDALLNLQWVSESLCVPDGVFSSRRNHEATMDL